MDIAKPSKGKIEEYVVSGGEAYGDMVFVRWAPGNGLAYRALFVRVPDSFHEALGCGEGAFLVSVYDGGWRSYTLTAGCVHTEWYIGEKFGDNGRDFSLAVASLVNMMIGDVAYGEELYEKIVR